MILAILLLLIGIFSTLLILIYIMEWIGKKEDEKIYPPLNSNEFFYEIVKLIDTYGSDAVIAASQRAETAKNRYRYVSRGRNDFRDFHRKNAAKPKKYKDCWITQDYGNAHAGRIFVKIRIECERGFKFKNE